MLKKGSFKMQNSNSKTKYVIVSLMIMLSIILSELIKGDKIIDAAKETNSSDLEAVFEVQRRIIPIDVKDLEVVGNGETLIATHLSGKKQLINKYGQLLSKPFDNLEDQRNIQNVVIEEYKDDDKDTYEGLLNQEGKVIIPIKYDRIISISNKWTIGAIAVEYTGEDGVDYDFKSRSSINKYRYYDFYYNDVYLATVNSEECKGVEYINAYEDYLAICDNEGDYHFYDKYFKLSPLDQTSRDGTEEFYEYRHGDEYSYDPETNLYYHNGSGQVSFSPECNLHTSEVEVKFKKIISFRHIFVYDLYGNLAVNFPIPLNHRIYFNGNDYYGKITDEYTKKEGVINALGEIIIPPIYDEVALDSIVTGKYGALCAKSGQKQYYLNTQGDIICEFDVTGGFFHCPTFMVIDDGSGKKVYTCKAGLLPETYRSAYISDSEDRTIIVSNYAGQTSLIDIEGNVLIPFDPNYEVIESNADGTVALVRRKKGGYLIYQFDFNDKDFNRKSLEVDESTIAASIVDKDNYGSFEEHVLVMRKDTSSTGTIITDNTNVYKEPNSNSEILLQLKQNDIVSVLSKKENWIKVYCSCGIGYLEEGCIIFDGLGNGDLDKHNWFIDRISHLGIMSFQQLDESDWIRVELLNGFFMMVPNDFYVGDDVDKMNLIHLTYGIGTSLSGFRYGKDSLRELGKEQIVQNRLLSDHWISDDNWNLLLYNFEQKDDMETSIYVIGNNELQNDIWDKIEIIKTIFIGDEAYQISLRTNYIDETHISTFLNIVNSFCMICDQRLEALNQSRDIDDNRKGEMKESDFGVALECLSIPHNGGYSLLCFEIKNNSIYDVNVHSHIVLNDNDFNTNKICISGKNARNIIISLEIPYDYSELEEYSIDFTFEMNGEEAVVEFDVLDQF